MNRYTPNYGSTVQVQRIRQTLERVIHLWLEQWWQSSGNYTWKKIIQLCELNYQGAGIGMDEEGRNTEWSNTTSIHGKASKEFDAIRSHKPMAKPILRQNHQKSRNTSHHINKTKSPNIAEPATHLNSVQIWEDVLRDVSSWAISEQCVKAVVTEEAQLIT